MWISFIWNKKNNVIIQYIILIKYQLMGFLKILNNKYLFIGIIDPIFGNERDSNSIEHHWIISVFNWNCSVLFWKMYSALPYSEEICSLSRSAKLCITILHQWREYGWILFSLNWLILCPYYSYENQHPVNIYKVLLPLQVFCLLQDGNKWVEPYCTYRWDHSSWKKNTKIHIFWSV